MTDADRSPHQVAEQVYSQSCPETCVRFQSRATHRTRGHYHPLTIHSALGTSAMVLLVICMYFLSALVGYASCSSQSTTTVRLTDVAPNSFGTFNLKELDEVVYDIEILKVPVPEPQTDLDRTLSIKDSDGGIDGDDKQAVWVDLPTGDGSGEPQSDRITTVDDIKITHSEDNSQENQHLVLLSKYGQKYLCTLPKDIVDVDSNSSNSGNETKASTFNVSALLHPLTKRPCLTRNTGWWTYEYCHGDYIRQYHSEAAKTMKNLWIGYYQNETVWTHQEINKAKERIKSLRTKLSNFQVYHRVDYVNGTICDLTGKPRRAIVKVTCSLSGEEQLLSVEERETCDYVLHVETPLLCKQQLFRVSSFKKPHSLSCSPLVSQEEFQQYTEKQERLKVEEEQLLKEQQEKLAARKKKAASSKPARKKYMTVSDFLDPDADLDEITEQVKEEIMARKTGDGHGGVRLSVGSSKAKSKSGLFDSGTVEDQETIDEQEQGDETLEDDEELQKMADRFGKDVIEGLMKGLSAQMSDWAKEKESPLRNAWERAIKKTQNTVAKLAEMKEGDEKLRPDKTSKLEDLREDVKKKVTKETPKPSSLREKHHSSLNQATKYQEQDQKSSRTDSTAVDKNENMPSREEEMKDTQILRDKIQQLIELNQEALNKRLEIDRKLDKEDLYVEEEEEEEKEEEEEVKDAQILRDKVQKPNHRNILNKRPEVDKELDTISLDEEVEDKGEEGEEEEEEVELDEESLEQLGEDITEEIQKQLDDIGLGNNADIKVKVFTLPYNMLHKLTDDEEDDIDGDDEDFDDSLEEDRDGEELDAYGNPKESTTESSSSSYVDKDLPAGLSMGLEGSHGASKSVRKKGKRDNSEVKVFHVKLDNLFGWSEREEEGGSGDSSSKGSKGMVSFSSLLEQLMNPMTEERKKVNELESNYEQVWEDIDRKETEKRKVE